MALLTAVPGGFVLLAATGTASGTPCFGRSTFDVEGTCKRQQGSLEYNIHSPCQGLCQALTRLASICCSMAEAAP